MHQFLQFEKRSQALNSFSNVHNFKHPFLKREKLFSSIERFYKHRKVCQAKSFSFLEKFLSIVKPLNHRKVSQGGKASQTWNSFSSVRSLLKFGKIIMVSN